MLAKKVRPHWIPQLQLMHLELPAEIMEIEVQQQNNLNETK